MHLEKISLIKSQIRIAYIIAIIGINSWFWTGILVVILYPEDRLIILISLFLWLLIYLFLLIFLFNASTFIKKTDETQKRKSKILFPLLCISYGIEFTYALLQNFGFIETWVYNIALFFIIRYIWSIHNNITSFNINRFREEGEKSGKIQNGIVEIANNIQKEREIENLKITINDDENTQVDIDDFESVMIYVDEMVVLAKNKQRREMDISKLDDNQVESLKKFVQILQERPYTEIKFKSWLDLGRLARRLEMENEAEFLYDIALKYKPNHVRAWNSKGNLFMSQNRYDEAENAYKTALLYNPSYFISIRNLALLFQKSQRYKESVEMYKIALEYKPEDIISWQNLGNVYHYLEDWRGSVVCWENAIKYGYKDSTLNIRINENKEKLYHSTKINQIQKEKQEQVIFKGIEQEIKEEERKLSLIEELITLIKQFTNDVPISLDRISKLLKIPEKQVESYLKELLVYQENLGDYLELEHIFIKRSQVEDNIEKVIQNTNSKPFSSLQECTNCNNTQSVLIRECSNCSAIMPYCQICKRGFTDKDTIRKCQHCNKQFHSVHIRAYIQSKGACPVCREGLNEKMLI